MMKLYVLISLIVFAIGQSNAQSHVLRGTVSDKQGSIPGVNIVEVDENDRVIKGAITDFDGNYTIQLSRPNATVNYSFIGYKSHTEEIAGREIVDVELVSDAQTIDEVIVIGKKTSSSLTNISERDRTGSAVSIDMSESKSLSVTSVGDALQGQIAGLDIMGGGSPGAGSNIVIRGLGSLGNSNPLIVVDGIVQRVSTDDIDLGSADTEDIGMLVSIAPEDIESVRVLKDAAETAVWGSRGANGVIEITTLSGKKGPTKFNVNYKKSYTFEAPTIPMLNGDEYVSMQLEMWHNAQGTFDLPPEIANDKDFVDYYNYSQNTNWLEAISQVGEIDDFGFRFSGGGDKTTYFTSVNYQNTLGTVLNTASRRLTGRINLDYRISSRLKLNTQISYTNLLKEDNWQRTRQQNVRWMAFVKAPNMSIYEYDEAGNMSDNYFNPVQNYQGTGVQFFNPVSVANLSSNDREQNNFQTNFNLVYFSSEKLILRQTVSFQFNNTNAMVFLPYNAIGARWLDSENNSSEEVNSSGVLLSTRTTANFIAIDNSVHHLSGTVLWATSSNSSERISTYSSNGPSIFLNDPAANALKDGIQSGSSSRTSVGGMGQVLYKLYDKHIWNFNARLDANSSFGETFRWGLFPSVSYKWRFSDENFIKDLGIFDDSGIRMSWGRTGQSGGIGSYDRHGFFAEAGGGAYMDLPTLIPTQPELERLKWETSEMYNVGLDIEMLNHRLFLTVELYEKTTKDMLWRNYNIPSSAGYNSLLWYNEGGIKNRGWEFNTRVIALKRDGFNLAFNFNMYQNENTFTEFPSNLDTERDTELRNNRFPVKGEVGTPVGSFFGLKYEGVYPTTEDAVAHNPDGTIKYDSRGNPVPMSFRGIYQFEGGDAKYADINHDGVIDIYDVVYLGDSNPDIAGGFGVNMSYKRLQLNMNFLYRYGYQIVNEIAMETEGMGNRHNQSTAVLHRWRSPGQDFENMLPRAYLNNVANNLGSDRYVENGDFIRLNNIAVIYTFSRRTLEKLNLDRLKIGLYGRKIFTLTNYSGQDPEVNNRVNDPFWFGTDNGTVPSPRVFSLNIEIGF